MESAAPTLRAVEECIASRSKGLAFPPVLESRFELDTRERRSQRLRAGIVPQVIAYNLFLIPDWFLIADRFWLAVTLHALVVTPWIVAAGLVVRDTSPRWLREGAAASVPVVIVLQILTTFSLTRSTEADHYQYFVLLVLMFSNMVQRCPFWYAFAASSIIVCTHAVAVLLHPDLSLAIALVAALILSTAAYLLLISGYYVERDFRRSYLKTLREHLRHAVAENTSRRDALTDLANRHMLGVRLDELWSVGDDRSSPVAVIMLDIDHFKAFNDRYGHVAGDACIKRVAACLLAELRKEDLAVRYGGEELMLILPRVEMHAATRVAERVRRAIETAGIPHEAGGRHAIVTASFGVACAPVSAVASSELIAAADAALYAAKRNGRNQVWPRLMRPAEEADVAMVVPRAG